ncbi:MAG: endonuclease domain-containing protein [Crocinitomicaceae bacterium]
MYYNADKILFEYAALLRKHMTPEEKILWEELRHSRIGAKFRRQHPISRFVVDFYCHQHKLVIEVDGKIHLKPEVKAIDAERENEGRAVEVSNGVCKANIFISDPEGRGIEPLERKESF